MSHATDEDSLFSNGSSVKERIMYFFTNRGNQFGRGAVRETRASPRKDAGELWDHWNVSFFYRQILISRNLNHITSITKYYLWKDIFTVKRKHQLWRNDPYFFLERKIFFTRWYFHVPASTTNSSAQSKSSSLCLMEFWTVINSLSCKCSRICFTTWILITFGHHFYCTLSLSTWYPQFHVILTADFMTTSKSCLQLHKLCYGFAVSRMNPFSYVLQMTRN